MRLYSIDTSAWIAFFRKRSSPAFFAVEKVLANEYASVGIDGIVMTELLQGVRSRKETDLIDAAIGSLPYFLHNRDIFFRAGGLNKSLRAKGITIPITDAIIAATCIEYGAVLLTIDEHFKHFRGLKAKIVC